MSVFHLSKYLGCQLIRVAPSQHYSTRSSHVVMALSRSCLHLAAQASMQMVLSPFANILRRHVLLHFQLHIVRLVGHSQLQDHSLELLRTDVQSRLFNFQLVQELGRQVLFIFVFVGLKAANIPQAWFTPQILAIRFLQEETAPVVVGATSCRLWIQSSVRCICHVFERRSLDIWQISIFR